MARAGSLNISSLIPWRAKIVRNDDLGSLLRIQLDPRIREEQTKDNELMNSRTQPRSLRALDLNALTPLVSAMDAKLF
jgi:hypothetical protein